MKARVRVVHVIGGGEFGGAERYVLDLVTRLDETVFQPMVVCGYEARFARTLRGVGGDVQVLPGGPAALPTLTGRLGAVRPAIVHTHGVRGNFFGRLAAWHAGVPAIVTTVHSDFRLDYPELRKRAVYTVLESVTAPMATRFVAVSATIKSRLVERGVDPGRITVISNGVDTKTFRPRRGAGERLRAGLGLGADIRLVGMVARMHPVKGHDLFMRAVAVLERTEGLPEVRFLAVGGGPPAYRRKLEKLAADLEVADRVLFTGEVEDVADVLSGLDLAVVPSRFEGFSLSAIEAMACGVPVVATAVGAIPEIVKNGVNGLFVREDDPVGLAAGIAAVLKDHSLARRLVKAGLETAGMYTLDVFARRTGDFYLQLCPTNVDHGDTKTGRG